MAKSGILLEKSFEFDLEIGVWVVYKDVIGNTFGIV